MIFISMIGQIVACLVSGAVHYFDNRYAFYFIFSIARIVQGIGSITIQTANYSIMMKTFPEDLSKAAGFIEALAGTGLVLGPALGSGLYALGGFPTPFYFCAGVFLISSFFVFKLIPASVETQEQASGEV